jgi:hypothetical protein
MHKIDFESMLDKNEWLASNLLFPDVRLEDHFFQSIPFKSQGVNLMLKSRSYCLLLLENCLMKSIFSILFFLCIAGNVQAANHIRYVDGSLTDRYSGSETGDCNSYSAKSGTCGGGTDIAYQSIEDVNKFLQKLESNDTASIFFKKGGKWKVTAPTNALKISKSNIYVGAFGSGNMPIFDGQDRAINSMSINVHPPLIQVSGDNCTIESIQLINAYGSALRLSDVKNGVVKNCRINKAGWAGVAIAGYSQGVVVEKCEITRVGWRGDQGPEAAPGMDHPQAIQANTSGVNGCRFRYNHIYNCYTEGIGASGQTVEFNLVGPTTASGIYAGEKTSLIRYNVVYGTLGNGFNREIKNGRKWCASGIGLDEEKAVGTGKYSEIYGNIVVGRYAGLRVRNMTKQLGKEAYVYNNTFIDNAYNVMVSAPEYWKITFKNNLSIVYDKTYSKHVVCWGDSYSWNIGPNHWSSNPEESSWLNTTRDEISDPKLTKTNGWTSLTGVSSFSFSNLIPPLNSTAINNSKAIKLSSSNGYQLTFLASGTDFKRLPNNPTFKLVSQNSSGNYWDFGAIVANGSSSQNASSTPPAPSLWIVQ